MGVSSVNKFFVKVRWNTLANFRQRLRLKNMGVSSNCFIFGPKIINK